MKHLYVISLLTLALALPVHAVPGDVDTLDANVVGSYVHAVAVQPDGKTIIAGGFTSVLSQPRNNIARLNADGMLDVIFNPNVDGSVYCVAVQADGKILIGGKFTTVGGIGRNNIARVAADGTLDTGFNPNATNMIDPSSGIILSVAAQADGKILIGGRFTTVGGITRNRIARVNVDGTLDTGFNPSANPSTSTVTSLVEQADGKILLGGSFTTVGGVTRNRIARVNANGSLDTGFNPNANSAITSLVEQADGKILLGGSFTAVGGTTRNYIARVNANGTLDTGFNPSADSSVNSMVVQVDGRILFGGTFTAVGGTTRNYIARVNANGSLDTGFNAFAFSDVDCVALQADGKILLGGQFGSVNSTTRNRFARLLNDPAPQTLSVMDSTQVIWNRSGSSPEVSQVTVEQSTDSGATWTTLGSATRVDSTPDWQLTGLSLPISGRLRARSRTVGDSFGLIESVVGFSWRPPPAVTDISPSSGPTFGGTSVTITGTDFNEASSVTFDSTAAKNVLVANATTLTCTTPSGNAGVATVLVTTPSGTNVSNTLYTYEALAPTVTLSTANRPSNATTITIAGSNFNFDPTPENNTVTFTPSGTGFVTVATATSLTVTNLSGLTLGALSAVVTTNLGSSGAAVQVATVVAPGPGDLDPLNPYANGDYLQAVAIQPDRKIIIAGSFRNFNGTVRSNIARLNADGTLDAGFNPNVNGSVLCVAVQADGKILLGGSFTSVGGTTRNRIARVNADGTLDTGFNPSANKNVNSVVVQADGQILLGGSFTTLGVITRNRIARVNVDGTLDTGFDPNVDGMVNSMAVQPDGRILLGGGFTSVGGTIRNRIARLNADGTLDAGFDPNVDGMVNSMAVQPDGRILFGGGFTSVGGTVRNRIARVAADGALDAGFNPNAGSIVNSMAVQADGQILIGGSFTTIGGTARNRIARVAADGTLDANFNPDVGSDVYGVAVQADGRILLGGGFTSVGGNWRNLFARLLNDSATQTLSAVDATQVLWTRGGSSPEVSHVTVELSTDSGVNWISLGSATRVGSTPNWQLAGLGLPNSGQLRVRGPTAGGYQGGSSGLVEFVAGFSRLAPPTISAVVPSTGTTLGGTSVTIFGTNFKEVSAVTFGGTPATNVVVNDTTIHCTAPAGSPGAAIVLVITPSGANLANTFYTYETQTPTVTLSTANRPSNATTLSIAGNNFSPTPANNTVTFSPTGSGTVTAATATSLTVTGLSGLTLGALSAVVTTNGLSSGDAVQVATVVMPSPGDLDTLDTPVVGSYVKAIAVQPDGKTIIAGHFTSVLGQARNNIARLNADGTLDPGFNPNVSSTVNCVAVQADGKILLGGGFTSVGGFTRNRIARVNADGTLDLGFNPNADSYVYCVSVQADGQILLGGSFTSVGGTVRGRIARVAANGTLDTGFNPSANNTVTSVAVQADGKILLGGNFIFLGGTFRNCIARVAANGALDADFNPSANNTVNCVAVQADGKILLGGGFTSVGGFTRNRIARVNADGTLDLGFNPNADSYVDCVAVQADGKILLGGSFTNVGGITRNRIARVDADGTIDAGFNPNSDSGVDSVALQAEGRILLGGSFASVGGTARNRLAWLLNDPATQTLSAVDASQVIWNRNGSSPEVVHVTVEQSSNGGASWTSLGSATRVGSTPNWHLTNLSLPISGQLRARGRTIGGDASGSSGLVESLASYNHDIDSDGLPDAWELTYWPTTSGHGSLDDLDHDGYVNLLELALGLSPLVPNIGGLPPVTTESGYLTMTLAKQPGVTYEVQSAGSLLSALPDSFSTSSTTVLINDAATLKVRDNVLISTAQGRFMRVKVTTTR